MNTTKKAKIYHNRNEHTRVEFKSVLRIRPLLKKEREDPIVLEAIDSTSVALHPLPLSNAPPSSQDATVLTAQDEEYHFDRVFAAEASQDKVYLTVGQHTALEAMETLKKGDTQRKTHLLIGMGLASSGKTYTMAGNLACLSKRKHDSDGLVPRILDSFFSQSKHNLAHNKKKYSFAVQMSILQINQNKSTIDDCELVDLLQPVNKRAHSRVPMNSSGLGGLASSILNSMDVSVSNHSPSLFNKNNDEAHQTISIQQDPSTSEFFLKNGTQKACYSSEEARETLQKALSNSRKVTHKRYQSHVLVELQPQLVSNRSGRTAKAGEKIALLDLTGCEDSGCKQRTARCVDSLPNRSSAFNSILNCLKAIQHNEKIIGTLSNGLDSISEHSYNDDLSLDSDSKIAAAQGPPRKVPFRQHKVTMLLQQLFSVKQAEKTLVTILILASPSSHARADNKALMGEITALHCPPPQTFVSTGVGFIPKKKTLNNPRDVQKPFRGSKEKNMKIETKDDSIKTREIQPGIDKVPSMTYSDSTYDDDSLVDTRPPPIAPDFKEEIAQHEDAFQNGKSLALNSQASAPIDDSDTSFIKPPPVLTVNFPNNSLHAPGSTKSALTDVFPNEKQATSTISDNGDMTNPADSKFSYMKTINKVVHASKKTGRKVMERIAVTSENHVQLCESKLRERIVELEKLNGHLMIENQSLKEKNAELTEQLGKFQSQNENNFCANGSVCSHSICSSNNGASQPSNLEKSDDLKGCHDNDEDEVDDAYSIISLSRDDTTPQCCDTHKQSIGGKVYDEPLLELMANLNNRHPSGTVANKYDFGKAERSSKRDEDVYKVSDTKCEHHHSQGDYDNPLLQHMAMMNNMDY